MADDREYSNIYTIPPNYTDSGKLMGRMPASTVLRVSSIPPIKIGRAHV